MLLTVLTDLILLEKGILYNSFLIFCLFNVISLYELVLIKFVNCSGSQIASAKAAQHRLDRGVWTTVRFGDMRRSLSGMNLTCSLALFFLNILKLWLNFLIFHHDPNILHFLSACERLILVTNDANELRDYSILLYHCGLYNESLQYLKKYQELKVL
jgi:hypothetical protein